MTGSKIISNDTWSMGKGAQLLPSIPIVDAPIPQGPICVIVIATDGNISRLWEAALSGGDVTGYVGCAVQKEALL